MVDNVILSGNLTVKMCKEFQKDNTSEVCEEFE